MLSCESLQGKKFSFLQEQAYLGPKSDTFRIDQYLHYLKQRFVICQNEDCVNSSSIHGGSFRSISLTSRAGREIDG
jgi:hypothetical protein